MLSESLSEHKMYQKHVAGGSTGHGKNHSFLPDKERYDYSDGYKLRESVVCAGEIHISQAVDDQKAEDGRRQHLAEVVDDPGGFFSLPGTEYMEETGSGRCRGRQLRW